MPMLTSDAFGLRDHTFAQDVCKLGRTSVKRFFQTSRLLPVLGSHADGDLAKLFGQPLDIRAQGIESALDLSLE